MSEGLWPAGTVPYKICPELPGRHRAEESIMEWNSLDLLVQLVPHNGRDADFVEFVAAEQCSASTGRLGGRQEIRLTPGCRPGMVLHEICHTVGLRHEHTRPDRDDYVTVHLENIHPESLFNFQKQPKNGEILDNYDFASIMHYSQMAFSRNRRPTIVPNVGAVRSGVLVGQRRQLSDGDIARLRRLYGA